MSGSSCLSSRFESICWLPIETLGFSAERKEGGSE
jgi:hypothetical protein